MRYMLFVSLFIVVACQQPAATIPNDAPDELVFFDLPAFFQKEVEDLKAITTLKKTATINGQLETKEITDFDLSEELSQFINADINKATWKDQYQVDSIVTNQRLVSIRYTALNDNLRTKELMISYDKGAVDKIEIAKEIDNMAVKSRQVLQYFPKKGYNIINEQSLVLSGPQKVEIAVVYERAR